MEENQNKKNTRIFYLTLAVVLAVVAILIIATVVARRNTSNTPLPDDSSSQTPSDPPTSETDVLPEFSLPLDGEVSIDYSDSVPVYSQTMGDWRTHLGVDVSSELGTEVLAVADGTVTNVWNDPFMGTCVSIEHSGKAVSIYKNLNEEVGDGIVVGCAVKAGDVIGTVGETAMNEIASEPHLHYELTVDGKHVDPKEHIKFPKPSTPPEDATPDKAPDTNTEQDKEN